MGHMPQPLLFTRLLMYKAWVPRGARFWLVVFIALSYQLTGGIYLAALSQMVGLLAFLSEDVTMAGYCSLIGLNMIFPILFRWKFYFFTRQMFFVSSVGALVCAIAAMYATVPWVLWVICLAAGYFKMMGMFACMTTIQLNITPSRNFGAFFPVVYVLVCGGIQFSGLMTAYITYFTDWRMVYLVTVVLMLAVDAVVYFMMKPDHRSGPFVPLRGIDWIGHLLWTATSCVAAWLFCFGEHYDWWHSGEIWSATWLLIALLAITIAESAWRREPFIALGAFRHRATWVMIGLLLGMGVLQASAHVLQPVLMNAVSGYDYFTIVGFNYPELAGIIVGAILAYYAVIRLGWGLRAYFFTCFTLVTFYIMAIYFLINPATDGTLYYIPLFAFGMGEVMMESGITYMISRSIPFPHFFMNITITGFVRCGVGSAATAAIVERLFAWSLGKAVMTGSPDTMTIERLTAEGATWARDYLTLQNLMAALKECYGWLAILGVVMMTAVLLSNYHTAFNGMLPRLVAVARWLRHPATAAPPQ